MMRFGGLWESAPVAATVGSAQVAKKKNSVALFEVIHKTRRGEGSTDVPKWMGDQPPDPAEMPGPVRPEPTFPSPMASGAPEPIFVIAGDRLRLSLDYVRCAVAAGGLVVLLAVTFALGFWAGSGPKAGPAAPGGTMSERTPVGRHVLGGRKPSASGPTTQPVSGAKRQKGKWYLVIQALEGTKQGDLDEAGRIVAYCAAKGKPASIARYTHPKSRRQRYIVWSLKPTDSPRGEEAKKQAVVIEAIGKEYFRKHKTYDFRQRMRDGKFNPWFEVQQ